MKKTFIYFIIILFIPFSSKSMTPYRFFTEKYPDINDSNSQSVGDLAYLKFKNADDTIITGVYLCKGSSAIIKAAPQDVYENDITSSLSYEWHDGYDSNLISTNSSITINSDTINESKLYRVIVTQGDIIIRNSILVTVTDKVMGWVEPTPSITCEGVPIKIEGYGPSLETTFKWYKNDTLLIDENNSFLTVNEDAAYKVKMTDNNCEQPDNLFYRYVPYYTSLYIDIRAVNNDTTVCNSNLVTLSTVNNLNTHSPYAYQWQRNGIDIIGKTEESISVNQSGKYRLKATQGSCVSYSKEINITEADKFQKPTIYSPLEALCSTYVMLQSGHLNQDGDLIAGSGGRWFRNNVPISSSNDERILATDLGGWYKIVRGEGTSCEVSSDSIYIAETTGYMGKAKVVKRNFNDNILCGENDVQILDFVSYGITFQAQFNYQWKKNGENIDSYYSTTRHYVYSPGTYELEVSYGDCFLKSDPITIVQDTVYKPKIKYTELSLYCDSNRLISLTVDKSASFSGITWFRNGTPLYNPNQYFAVNVNQPGDYHFQIEKGGCTGISDTITIKSGPNNDFLVDKPSASYKNESAEISIESCGGEVKWYETETASDPFYTGKTYTTPILTDNVSYWVSCTEEYCESDRVRINLIPEECPENIFHTNKVPGRIYKSGQNIESSVNLPSGVTYDAGSSIILLPGFSVGKNEVFEARIGGCN